MNVTVDHAKFLNRKASTYPKKVPQKECRLSTVHVSKGLFMKRSNMLEHIGGSSLAHFPSFKNY